MRIFNSLRVAGGVAAAALVLTGCGQSDNSAQTVTDHSSSVARDYMVVANKPNQIHLLDLTAREVVRSCDVPGQFGPGTVQMGPENRIAYVLSNRFENLYGVDMDTCDITFSATQSYDDIRIKTIGAFAVSRDGNEVWIHQNPAQLNRDHYVALDARVAVYRTADGLNAKPVRTFEAPRQITLMSAGPGQTAYLGGRDIFEMNTDTGEYHIKLASQSDTNPLYSPRDSLSVWPIGMQSGEMIRMYSAARFQDASQNMDTADFVWGFERVDLNTGKAEMRDFGPLEVMLFSGMTRPGKPNEFYAALTQLKRYDVDAQTELASVDLDHSYYCVNFSTDGNEVYLGGTYNEIAIYDADTLAFKDKIVLPGGDQSLNTTQVFARL